MAPPKDPSISLDDMTQAEKEGLQKLQQWDIKYNAYAREHGTRPGTIGLVLSSSPVALLAW